MKLGICLPHYGRPIEVGRMLEVARAAEDAGLDSVWVTDHVIVPKTANVRLTLPPAFDRKGATVRIALQGGAAEVTLLNNSLPLP